MKMMKTKEFSAWLNKKFLEWSMERNRRPVVSEFAKYLGVSQPSLSRWLNGDYLPDEENLKKIVSRFNEDIFTKFDIPMPKTLSKTRYFIPTKNEPVEEIKKRLIEVLQEAEDYVSKLDIEDVDEIEEKRIAFIVERGFEHISTNFEDKDENKIILDLIKDFDEYQRHELMKQIARLKNKKGNNIEKHIKRRTSESLS